MNESPLPLIKSLKAAGQLGKIRDLGGKLEVEILRQGWRGLERSYLIFPEWTVFKVSEDEVYILREKELQEIFKKATKTPQQNPNSDLVIQPILKT